jgi:hypothetical protein
MPIRGYLLYVGSALIALLFVADLYVPRQAPRAEAPRAYNIPITAAQAPGGPIIFSGATRDFGRPPPMTVVDLASPSKAAPEQAQAKAAPAQAQVTVAARQEPKPARRKVARRKVSPENSYAQIPDEWRHRYTGMAFARPLGW